MDQTTVALLVAPIVLLELTMKVVALVSLKRQPRTRGPKPLWAVLILFTSIIGWALYFGIAREEA